MLKNLLFKGLKHQSKRCLTGFNHHQMRCISSEYPTRSVLFAPASRLKVVEKNRTLDTDVVILDLEDAVAPNAKEEARRIATEEVKKGGFKHKEVVIRINALDTQWGIQDLEKVATSGARAVVIPKVECKENITQVAHMMTALGSPEDMEIWAMIETPLGVLQLQEIAQSHPRLTTLVAGTSDLSKELKCATTRDRHALVPSLAQIVLAARAYQLRALDGVSLNLEDMDEFAFQCQQGKELGYDGKTLIHPKTIEITNKTYSPTEEEVAQARVIVKAFQEAAAAGSGVVVVDGKLIENLHEAGAKRLLRQYELIQEKSK